jgi:hypothetical protein
MIDTANLRAHHAEHGGGPTFDLKVFNHHNLLDEDTREAFRRRCVRFMDALRGEETVYLVYYNRNTNDCDEVVKFAERMQFRDGVTVMGIMKKDGGDNEVLHAGKGVVVVMTPQPESMMHYIHTLLDGAS